MRILLVNPQNPSFYTQFALVTPPLGLAYIAAVLREKGHEVEIIDLAAEDRPIDFSCYGLVGISSMTSNYNEALKLSGLAKKAGLSVVMGGYHVTFRDEEALQTGLVDYVVKGEGEYIMAELVEALEKKSPLRDIKGISYIKNRKIFKNPRAIPPQDLDALPFPARDLLDLKVYSGRLENYPTTSLITSRGCPFNCHFCASSQFSGTRWRARSPKSVVDEIEHLKKNYGYEAFYFVDDNFTLSPERVEKICNEIIARKLNIHWWALSRADTIAMHEDMIRKMAEAGAYMIFMGVESPDKETLRNYGKKEQVTVFMKARDILRKYRIKVWASFMIGTNNENKKKVKKTIKFAKKLKPFVAQFSILTPYPGTRLWEEVKNKLLTHNWNLFDCTHSVFRTKNFSRKELEKYLSKAYKSFYLRPSQLIRPFFQAIKNKHLIKTIKLYFKIWRASKEIASQ